MIDKKQEDLKRALDRLRINEEVDENEENDALKEEMIRLEYLYQKAKALILKKLGSTLVTDDDPQYILSLIQHVLEIDKNHESPTEEDLRPSK